MAATDSAASVMKTSTDAMPPPTGGLIDLEKELTCSICTEILYQPLTLLDCLHTFCGSCLKEWFGWQARGLQTASSRSRPAPKYTCPSCRAVVRETRPNSTVTTLVDMYIQANPDRAKTDAEKKEIAKVYKPGDIDVKSSQPRVQEGRGRIPQSINGEEEDRQIMDGVREVSLREVGVETGQSRRQGNSLAPSGRSEHRSRDRVSNGSGPTLEHQSSLRSLLSSSELDSQEMEDEIMRQIVEEGLLDGIDISNLDPNQEDEISERIAQAYRRRQRDRQRAAESRQVSVPERGRDSGHERVQRRATESPTAANASRPPLSRPHLIEATRQSGTQPRSSSQGSSGRVSRAGDQSRASIETSRPSLQSLSDPLGQTQPRESRTARQRRLSSQDRRSTDPESIHRASSIWRRGLSGEATSAQNRNSTPSPPASLARIPTPPRSTPSEANGNATSRATPVRRMAAPTVTCRGCSKQNIQFDRHYTCTKCSDPDGPYSLCVRCYRLGRGCRYWYGFGTAAWVKFQRLAPAEGYPPNTQLPHVMDSEKYLRPDESTLGENSGDGSPPVQRGVFCDHCHREATGCYWKCDACNDGEWGFCNSCVMQGKHCTHPLLPHAHGPTSTTPASLQPRIPTSQTLVPMPIRTTCNRCRLPIPPSHTRFHCHQCSNGDYDICTPCYTSLVASGKISAHNGQHGWRRCPDHGHRMIVVGFEDRGGRQRRIVAEGLVGGWALDDGEKQEAAPPSWEWRVDGGHAWKCKTSVDSQTSSAQDEGMRMVALWTRVPDEGDEGDEIMFPRGAEISEVVEINADWCWGVYCSEGGLFPGAFARILG